MKKFLNLFKLDKSLLIIKDKSGVLSFWQLLIPIFFEQFFNYLLGAVNTFVLSNIDETAVSAVGATTTVVSMEFVALSLVQTGTIVLISLFLGKGDMHTAGKTTGAALIMAIVLSLSAGGLMFLFSNNIVKVLGLSGEALYLANLYFKIRSITVVIPIATGIFCGALRCYNFAKPTFYIGIISNVVNLICCLAVLKCFDYNSVIATVGIGLSAVAGQFISLILSIVIFVRKKIPIKFNFNLKLVAKIFRIGAPSGVSALSYSFSQVITTSIITGLGLIALNAKIYLGTITYFVSIVSLSVGKTHAVMVGRLYGSKNIQKAKRLYAQNMRIGVSVNFISSVTVLIFYKFIMGCFTDNLKIISVAAPIFAVDVIVEVFRAMNHIGEHTLVGVGDSLFTMPISIISCWLISVMLSYLLGVKLEFGLLGCWIAFMCDEMTRSTVYYFRWKKLSNRYLESAKSNY